MCWFSGLATRDPVVRSAALAALENAPATDARAARVSAIAGSGADSAYGSRPHSGVGTDGRPASTQRRQLAAAGKEYIEAQLANAERPEAQTNLGNFYAAQGERLPAIDAYRTAIELAPYYVPAYVNLADFYRRLGQEDDALELLQRAVQRIRMKPLCIMPWGFRWCVCSAMTRHWMNLRGRQNSIRLTPALPTFMRLR